MLRLKKNPGTCKDFGRSFYEVWSDAFINYTSILASLFGAIIKIFYTNILQSAKVYGHSPFGNRDPHSHHLLAVIRWKEMSRAARNLGPILLPNNASGNELHTVLGTEKTLLIPTRHQAAAPASNWAASPTIQA